MTIASAAVGVALRTFAAVTQVGGSSSSKSQPIVNSGGITTGDWLRAAIVVAVAILVATAVNRIALRIVTAGRHSRRGVGRLVGRLVGVVAFLIGLVYALNTLGVRIGPLLGALGIAGVAIAFALQHILENFIAGVLIQARNPFRIGDQMESGEWTGTVLDVNFRAVVLRTPDGTKVVLPSSTVLNEPIQNLTAFSNRRTTVTVGVAYDTDLDRAAEIIVAATASADGVLEEPQPDAFVEDLAESSVNFVVHFWHGPQIAEMWKARDAVLRHVYRALGEAGIAIPFPQRTVSFLAAAGEPVSGERVASPDERSR